MKSVYFFYLFLPALVAGCVTGDSTLDQSKAVSLTRIHIVPIEGPPLSGMSISNARLSGVEVMASSPTIGSSSLAIVGGVMMLMSIPEADVQSATASRSIESLLDKKEIWEPTVEIAKETMRQLETATSYSVNVNPGIQPLPGVERKEATFFMENWMAPLRNWYNMNTSPFSYSGHSDSAAMLEVGLLNYELSGYLIIQVVMKLVDPGSGSVIANARCYAYPEAGDVEKLFADDAAVYKQLFRETTAALVTKCTEELGLHKT